MSIFHKRLVPLEEIPTAAPFWKPWARKTPYPQVRIGHLTLPPPPEGKQLPPVSPQQRALLAVALPVPPGDDDMARWIAAQPTTQAYLERWQNGLRRRYWALSHIAEATSDTCLRCGCGYRHISREVMWQHEALIWTCASCQNEIVGYARGVERYKGLGVREAIEHVLMWERSVKTDRPVTLAPSRGA